MRLDHDEFVVTYDAEQASIAELDSIIRKAGYTSRVVTGESTASTSGEGQESALEDPLLTSTLSFAKRENKLVILDFQAAWCVPCKRMEKETFADPDVAELLKQVVFVKVDTDEHPDLAKQFGVAGLPDVRILMPDGTELLRTTDFQDAQLFGETLRKLLSTTMEPPSGSNDSPDQ